jgi:hypothetical protein
LQKFRQETRPSQEDPFTEFADWFKEGYRRNFTSSRGLPEEWMALNEEARGSRNFAARNMRRAVTDLQAAMKETGYEDHDAIATALALPSDAKNLYLEEMPPKVQAAIVQMRGMIDGYSKSLVVNDLVTPTQAEAISRNLGDYLTRAYKLHTVKDWIKKVPEEVKRDAVNFLAQQHYKRLVLERDAAKEKPKEPIAALGKSQTLVGDGSEPANDNTALAKLETTPEPPAPRPN